MKRGVAEKVMPLFVDVVALELRLFEFRIMFFRDFIGPSRNPNEDLKWEKKKEWNFGVDFGVLDNRITGALDVYKRTADDLLMTGVTVPSPSYIHSTSTVNIGSISSSGLELTLNAVPIAKEGFPMADNGDSVKDIFE